MKPYYTDYASHCLRYYFRYKVPNSNSKAQIDDWNACKRACSALKSSEMELVKEMYSSTDSAVDGLYIVSRKHNIKPDVLWDLMRKIEKTVAIERGLL